MSDLHNITEKEILPMPVNTHTTTDMENNLPPEYTLSNPSFPSVLDADRIYDRVELFYDEASDFSSGDEGQVEVLDDVRFEDPVSRDSPDDDHDLNKVAETDTYSPIPLASQQPLPYPYISSATIHIRNPTLLSARSISTRTRTRNERLIRRKTVPKKAADANLVTWESATDPENPHNWPQHRKWTSTVLIAAYAFIAPMASTIVAPALEDIADEFNIARNSAEEFLVMSIFLLAFAIGPFLWGPLSEVFGRVRVMQGANLIFLLFNTVCGFAKTKQQMMAFRFLSGIGGSAPQAVSDILLLFCC